MVFVEFISKNPSGRKHYFVGADLQDVLTDTKRVFSFLNLSFLRQITEKEAVALQLDLLKEGIASVEKGCKSFKLRTP